MFKNEYSDALKQWVKARRRTEIAEEKIGRTLLDWLFHRGKEANQPPVRPFKNVTPPKEPPKQ